jgi:UDP-2,3-diacylglucosamine pyrophosphatase LpxH
MNDLPQFDDLHVISDLHMGGRPGFQILRQTSRLAAYVDHLRLQAPERQVALVLNGDVFDTLAEEGSTYIAVETAVSVVTRIMDDASFKPVWDALAAFVQTPQRSLVFVIGNHDIEVALPPVQRLIRERLTGGQLDALARLEFSTMGAGFTATVAGAKVYCTHGNEVDIWNYNRYEDLSRVARHLNAGKPWPAEQWHANAGTRMVKDVMNKVKQRFAWIDLLKPETKAALSTLLVLAPEYAKDIRLLTSVLPALADSKQQVKGRLAIDLNQPTAAGQTQSNPMSLEQMLGPNLSRRAADNSRDMLLQAEKNFQQPRSGTANAAGQAGTLGLVDDVKDQLGKLFQGLSKTELLRRALADWMAKDTSFDVQDKDDTCKDVVEAAGQDVAFIVTGHTHLARAIELTPGARFYLNCGTWIRLMRLSGSMLKDEANFQPVYNALVDGQMSTMDTFKTAAGEALVLDATHAVSISASAGGKATGQLNQVLDGPGGGVVLKPVKTFTRS